ncbi:MAG: hydantoinase/carbamoylase family amidase, partial [Rhodospirillaceae bacterium]|nr:hydantoinase/carbamoylase family amidase [Rhodospirillaceae bacterium]
MAERRNLPLIDGQRLWDSLMESGRIGPGKAGGLRRVALSDADGEMRDLYRRWCEDAGLTVTVDAMGSMYARRAGREDHLPPVLIGSHLDTQVAGGKYDGILGVLGGLEILRTLNDRGIETRRPIEVVNWTNEEGARFNPPMVASGVFAGVFERDWALAREDDDGIVFGEELKRLGYAGDAPVGGREVDSYFELHIEQDDALERLGIPLGIVTGGYAARGFNVRFEGETAHTGPTPMAKR